MNEAPGRISSYQAVLLLIAIGSATIFQGLTSFLIDTGGQAGWLGAIAAALIATPLVASYVILARLFPDETIYQYSPRILGKVGGTLAGLSMVGYFLYIVIVVFRVTGDFLISAVLWETPISALILILVVLTLVAVYLGIESLARYTEVAMPVFLVSIVVIVFLAVPQMNLGQLLPIYGSGLRGILKGGLMAASVIMETLVILVLYPSLRDKPRLGWWPLMAAAVSAAVFGLIAFAEVAFFGAQVSQALSFPIYSLISNISLSSFFERFDALSVVIWVAAVFTKVSLAFYAALLGIRQIFGIRRAWWLPLLLATLTYVAALLPESLAQARELQALFGRFALFYAAGLPLLLLVVARLRRLRGGTPMTARAVAAILVACLAISASGCWSRIEIENLAFILMVGVDLEGQDYLLTIQLAITKGMPAGETGGDIPAWIVQGRGRTLTEALDHLQSFVGKRLFWSSVQVLLIGEGFARSDIAPLFELFLRAKDFRITPFMALAAGRAANLVYLAPKITTTSTDYLTQLLMTAPLGSKAPTIRLLEALRRVHNYPAQNIYLPYLKPHRGKTADTSAQGGEGTQELLDALDIGGIGIFREGRLAGVLEGDLARGFMKLTGRSEGGIVKIQLSGGYVVYQTTYCRSLVRVRERDGRIRATISVIDEGILRETVLNESREITQEFYDELKKKISESIRQDCLATLHTLQKGLKVDALDVGEMVRRHQPVFYRSHNWNEVFPEAEIEVEVQTYIRRAGLVERTGKKMGR
ncbi:MAG: Ger(x)C family spore germination protein [Bacillota bacterium]